MSAMPSRNFVDGQGVEWRVWNTVPSPRTVLGNEFAAGWLTFESATCLRRLAPIPKGWDTTTVTRLELMCRAATEVPRHTPGIPQDAIKSSGQGADAEEGSRI